jgi:hypothetical protein
MASSIALFLFQVLVTYGGRDIHKTVPIQGEINGTDWFGEIPWFSS